jgi:diaminopimelate decarboxylase
MYSALCAARYAKEAEDYILTRSTGIYMKKAFLTEQQAKEIAAVYPIPFHIYDEKGLIENARAVNRAFSWNKGFREYFAVKATPNPEIMKILMKEGCGFDCSSMAELVLAKAVGADKDRIMFSSNDTPAEEFQYASRLGAIINLDDYTHIDYLEKIGVPFSEMMCCRYNPGGVFKMSNGIMDNPGDSKYGMTDRQLEEAFTVLKKKGVKKFGIHAFLASNTVTNDYYPQLSGQLFRLAVELHEKTGADIAFVNLSGGVGIPYQPDQTGNDIEAIGEGVRREFEKIMVPAGLGDTAIFTEMGRFMTGPYGALVTKAIHAKHIYKEYIGVDACAANLMRPAMYGAYHHITVLGKENAPADHVYDVTGSLCENNDKFAVDRKLPAIETGDYLFIHDTGAHGFSMGYNYNGRLWSSELLLQEDGTVRCIRRAQTLRDYFSTFDTLESGKEIEAVLEEEGM